MCGICGIVLDQDGGTVDAEGLLAMNAALVPRGPDDEGLFLQGQVGLAMRRLSIIDVAGGHQPIHNEDKTVWVVFNGEIYNFQELRTTLANQGHQFYTQTDTEVLVHLYERDGQEFVKRLRGMFAFALWDARRKTLLLARDRLGIKPLYYARTRGGFLFASELKALVQHPLIERRLNAQALDSYFTYGYIPAPQTIFQDICKLEPATLLTVRQGQVSRQRYWELRYTEKAPGTLEELSEQLIEQLRDAVRSHLVSDVPLGAFLSGGLDSSAIVALMSGMMDRPVKTFSLGYEGQGDELGYARLVARRFGTEHHELVVSPNMTDLLPDLVWAQDEPLFDNSILPTYLVSRLAREHVTVALSGDGGDELFGGYEWTRRQQFVQRYRRLPGPFRAAVRGLLLGRRYAPGYETGRLHQLRRFVHDGTLPLEEGFARRTTVSTDFRARLYTEEMTRRLDGYDALAVQRERFAQARVGDEREKMLYVDTTLFLPDDCLFKVDRMSMANSLEVRVPLLDHRVVEFASRLPFAFKLSGRTTKRILKYAMRRRLPPAILRQRKQGFTLPIAAWLRGDLGALVEQVVLGESAAKRNLVDRQTVRWMLEQHRSGRQDFSHRIWSVLIFEVWAQLYLDQRRPTRPTVSLQALAAR